jgi:hypothetical protein
MLRMAVSALIALSLDLFSEVVIIHWLDLPSVHTIHVWPPYFNLVMAWNTGIDFGLLSNYGGRWLLVVFPHRCLTGADSMGAQQARLDPATTRCKAMCKPLFTIYTPTLTGLVYE